MACHASLVCPTSRSVDAPSHNTDLLCIRQSGTVSAIPSYYIRLVSHRQVNTSCESYMQPSSIKTSLRAHCALNDLSRTILRECSVPGDSFACMMMKSLVRLMLYYGLPRVP